MNARIVSPTTTQPVTVRFDRKFIEEHRLVDRYLEGKLPFKGARDLENWCREHPDYLQELKLADRAQSSLKLLDASGRPLDLREPTVAWWKTIYFPIGLGVVAFVSLVAFWALFGKYEVLRGKLDDTRTLMSQGSLVQPAKENSVHLAPDPRPGIDHAKIVLSKGAPQLLEVYIDLTYTQKLTQFRLVVDKKDQGRALIVNNMLKDSNGEIGLTLNSTGLAAGTYNARIDAYPPRGGVPYPVGYLLLEVH